MKSIFKVLYFIIIIYINKIIMVIILLVFLSLLSLQGYSACHHNDFKIKHDLSRSAISILHPDNGSNVKGLVSIHQPNPLSPAYF